MIDVVVLVGRFYRLEMGHVLVLVAVERHVPAVVAAYDLPFLVVAVELLDVEAATPLMVPERGTWSSFQGLPSRSSLGVKVVSDIIIVWCFNLPNNRYSGSFSTLEVDLTLGLVKMINIVLMMEGLLPYVLAFEDFVKNSLGVSGLVNIMDVALNGHSSAMDRVDVLPLGSHLPSWRPLWPVHACWVLHWLPTSVDL